MLIAALALMVLGSEQTSVDVVAKFSEGAHFACETDFEVVVEDTAYFRGKPVAALGNFAFYNWPENGRAVVGMKLGILAVENGGWSAPDEVYIVNGYATNLKEQLQKLPSDSPGFRNFIYDLSGEETGNAILRLAGEGRLDVAYTYGGGTLATTFSVVLSEEQAAKWGDCVSALAKRDKN
jgi:hypothetical protein